MEEKVRYTNMAKELLGDELYCKLIKEISKEGNNVNMADFGNEVVDKCCFLIVAFGMSKILKLDNVKICIGTNVIEISCKEFAMKYENYIKEVEKNAFKTI